MTREVIVGATAERAIIVKPPQLEGLAWGQDSSEGDVVFKDKASHRTFHRRHSGTLNESTNVSFKTGGSRVGGPELCV